MKVKIDIVKTCIIYLHYLEKNMTEIIENRSTTLTATIIIDINSASNSSDAKQDNKDKSNNYNNRKNNNNNNNNSNNIATQVSLKHKQQ